MSKAENQSSTPVTRRAVLARTPAAIAAAGAVSLPAIASASSDDDARLIALVDEYLPPEVLAGADVLPLAESLKLVHRPKSLEEANRGRGRLAFEELFFVHLLRRRAHLPQPLATRREPDDRDPVPGDVDHAAFRAQVPFASPGP